MDVAATPSASTVPRRVAGHARHSACLIVRHQHHAGGSTTMKRFRAFTGVGMIVTGAAVLVAASWSSTGSMSSARADFGATALGNGKVLACGGTTGTTILSTCDLYDPTSGTWSATGSMGNARSGFGMVRLTSGKVMAISGILGGPSTSTETYDPNTGGWSSSASMLTSRRSFGAVVLANGKVL